MLVNRENGRIDGSYTIITENNQIFTFIAFGNKLLISCSPIGPLSREYDTETTIMENLVIDIYNQYPDIVNITITLESSKSKKPLFSNIKYAVEQTKENNWDTFMFIKSKMPIGELDDNTKCIGSFAKKVFNKYPSVESVIVRVAPCKK